ncbi:hypothetical protein [Flavimaricola marinus]|nr:hypothetical protein [Flavimaricola marinus]
MTFHRLLPLLALIASPALSAGSDPLPLGIDGPWIAIPAATDVNIGPLSDDAIAALADLDGDPSITTDQEAAMIALLMQVLGSNPRRDAPLDD